MNKKGLTLVELLLVVVIIGIISAVTIPNIMEAYSESKRKGGESVEKMLIENLTLYNKDNEEDLWNIYGGEEYVEFGTINISISDLYSTNPDIDLGECLFKNGRDSLSIYRDQVTGNYTYKVKIVCSKEFDGRNDTDKVADESQLNSTGIYYDSE